MSTLRISLFGRVQVFQEKPNREVRMSKKLQELLVYLLLKRQHCYQPREVLIRLFWEDYEINRARNCLNTALWRLRRALSPAEDMDSCLETTSDGVCFKWNNSYWLDIAIFDTEVSMALKHPIQQLTAEQAQTLETALALYQGDILEGCYEDWIVSERRHLRQLYISGLIHLMNYSKHRQDYKRSLACGCKLLQLEPLREDIHRQVMELYLANGQKTLALRQYQVCCQTLAQEIEAEPMPETIALYRRIVSMTTPAVPSTLIKDSPDLQNILDELRQARLEVDRAQQKLARVTKVFEQFVWQHTEIQADQNS